MAMLLDDLNSEQRRAVVYDGSSLVVVAGPGSGKTRVVTRRIAHRILGRDTAARRILAVTFTNRAAREMVSRVQMLVGSPFSVPIGTFHWMSAGILRRRIGVLGYRPDFRVLHPWEARTLMQSLVSDGGRNADVPLFSMLDAVSGLKSGVGVEPLAQRAGISPERLRHVADAYAQALRGNNALDLDDLPFLAATVLREYPRIRERCQATIDELLVDEYQDTNAVQQELVQLLAPPAGTVAVVGDEDQAIYGWRHADASGFKRFRETFPATEVVMLQRSYRHRKFVARAANALMSVDRNRTEKTIRTELPAGERPVCFVALDERDEAEWIADEIGRIVSPGELSWNDIAVLYRINAQSRALEDALVRRNVPYHVLSSHGFYARAHVQMVIAFLRLALDRDDNVAAELLLNSIPGMGSRRVTDVRAWAEVHGVSLVGALSTAEQIPRLPYKVRLALMAMRGRIDGVWAIRKGSLVGGVEAAIQAAERGLTEDGLLTESMLEDFGEFRSVAHAHHVARGTLRSLADTLVLGEPAHDSRDGVHLMSLHSAKGLEYSAVFVCGLEEGLLPHARSLHRLEDVEEERRLCYVGMTRAKEYLYLSYARARLLGGRTASTQSSRFIREIGLHNMALKVSMAKRPKPRIATASEGDRVHHTHWGAGTVERVEGTGQETLTTILFDTAGRRRLQLCHAPLSLERESPSDVSAG